MQDTQIVKKVMKNCLFSAVPNEDRQPARYAGGAAFAFAPSTADILEPA